MKINPFRKKDTANLIVAGKRGTYKKKTFATVADAILIKKMKADPNFGLEMAKKFRGIDENKGQAPQGIKELLKQQVELKELITELTGGEKANSQNSWWQVILANAIDKQALQQLMGMIAGVIASKNPEAMDRLANQMGMGIRQIEPSKQIPATAPDNETKRIETPKSPEDTAFKMMVSVIKLDPKEAILELYKMNQEIIPLISGNTYESIVLYLKSLKISQEYEEYRQVLCSEAKEKWLQDLIIEAKALKKAQ